MIFETAKTSFPSVLIIVPNKDGTEHLPYSLASISKIEYPNLKVVVVDNCSTDNSIEYVRTNYPEFEVLRNQKDKGFAGSVNRGIIHGLQLGVQYIVVFSNDVKVHSQWLMHSITIALAHPESGIIGFTETNGSCDETTLKIPHTVETSNQPYPHCRAIYIFRAETIKNVGLYDELYWMYGEEDDIFYRCAKAGYDILQTNIPVWHRGEGFSDSIERQRIITRYVYRNWLRLALKNYNIKGIIITLAKLFAYVCGPKVFKHRNKNARSVQRLIRFGLSYRIKCFLYAIGWNLINIWPTYKTKINEKTWIKKIAKTNYNLEIQKSQSPTTQVPTDKFID